MHTWIAKHLFIKPIVVSLDIILFFFAVSCFLIPSAPALSKSIIECKVPALVHKDGEALFTITVSEVVDTVTLFYKTNQKSTDFVKVFCKKTGENTYDCLLRLSDLKTQPEKIYYYVEAIKGFDTIDKTPVAEIALLEKVEISEIIRIPSEPLKKAVWEKPYWKKWWFWLPVSTVAIAGVVIATQGGSEKKSTENLELSPIRIRPLFDQSDATARCETEDCRVIDIFIRVPCDLLLIRYEVDILKGTPPFHVEWSIDRWKEGQAAKDTVTYTEETSSRSLTSPDVTYCVQYSQTYIPIDINVTVTDKNNKTASDVVSVSFAYWTGN